MPRECCWNLIKLMVESAESLAGLRDVRLPDGADAFADACAGFLVGMVAALILAAILRVIFSRAASRRELALAELRNSRKLDFDARLLSQARLVNAMLSEPDFRPGPLRRGLASRLERWVRLRSELRDVLYRPRPPVDLDRFDRAIAGLIRRLRS